MDLNALIGRDIAGFRLTHRLGEGGMAMVFRGENVLDPSIVRAIKIVHPHLSAQPEFVKRITLEARILDQLHHPNIVRFYGLRQASVDHTSLLLMELEMLDGQALSTLVRPNLPVAQAVEWIRQASEGVAAAHALGIVHRDLKPDNLLVTKSGQIKVLDFGIAKAFDDTRRLTQVTMAGVIPGTPGYMAPEICNGAVPTAAADVYALGVTLCELLLGRHPFAEPGQAPLSGLQMMFAHTQRDMPQISTYRTDVPKHVESAIVSATVRDVSRRCPSGVNFAQALIAFEYSSSPVPAPNPSPAVSWTSFQLPSQGNLTASPSIANSNASLPANIVAPAIPARAGSSPSVPPQTAFLLPSPAHGLLPGYAPSNAPTAMMPSLSQARTSASHLPLFLVAAILLVGGPGVSLAFWYRNNHINRSVENVGAPSQEQPVPPPAPAYVAAPPPLVAAQYQPSTRPPPPIYAAPPQCSEPIRCTVYVQHSDGRYDHLRINPIPDVSASDTMVPPGSAIGVVGLAAFDRDGAQGFRACFIATGQLGYVTLRRNQLSPECPEEFKVQALNTMCALCWRQPQGCTRPECAR